jgi:site-specific DNA recombinase
MTRTSKTAAGDTAGPDRAVILLRLSDFRDEDDAGDETTFDAREQELRDWCGDEGYEVVRVAIENDTDSNGKLRGASAYKRPVKVITPSGLVNFRTRRPVWASVLLDLQEGRADVLVCEDMDRACRDFRDLSDLLDAVAVRGASAVSPSGSLRLTRGGTPDEIETAHDRVKASRKASADTARRVAKGRKRWAAKGSYFGGRRPFGYTADPDAPEHKKTLIVVPDEAAVIRSTAKAVLRRDEHYSLRFIARQLREDGAVPTVTGVPWTAEILKDVLCKPAVASILVHQETEHPGSWAPILEEDTWRAVKAILTDPARRTTTENAPRWLLSGIARCACGCQECASVGRISVTGGRDKAPGYTCRAHSHIRRGAAATDAYVGLIVTKILAKAENAGLLLPAPRAGVDAKALRAGAKALREQLDGLAAAFADGDIDRQQLAAGTARVKAKSDRIAAQLAAHDEVDPLAEFRGQPDAGKVWAGLGLARQRALVDLMATVTLLPSGRKGRGFDPASVDVVPRAHSDGEG